MAMIPQVVSCQLFM